MALTKKLHPTLLSTPGGTVILCEQFWFTPDTSMPEAAQATVEAAKTRYAGDASWPLRCDRRFSIEVPCNLRLDTKLKGGP